MWRIAFPALATVTAILLFSSFATADDSLDPNEGAAKQQFQEGSELFEKKKFEDAVHAFRAAYQIKPTWKLHYNIAQAETAAKRYGLGLEEFEAYLAKGGDDVLADREQEVLKEIDRLRLLVGVLEVDASPGTEVYVDATHRGTVPFKGLIRVAVGEHHVTMKKDGAAIFSRRLKIAGGVNTWVYAREPGAASVDDSNVTGGPRNRDASGHGDDSVANGIDSDKNESNGVEKIRLNKFKDSLKQADFRRKLLISGIATAGVGGIGLIVGGVFTGTAAKAADKRDEYARLYEDTNDQSYLDEAEKKQSDLELNQKGMVTGFVVGGVLTVAGGAILAIWYRNNKKYRKVSVMPTANGVRLTF